MTEPDAGSAPGMPRWVKVFIIVAVLVVLALVAVFAISGGEHGPGRHLPGGGDSTPSDHSPPGGHS